MNKTTVTTLTNTHKPVTVNVSGIKYWSDGNDRDGIRPETVTVQLLADGKPVEGKKITVGAAENWTWKFDELPRYEAGREITYSIEESPVDGYTAAYSGMYVTNYHIPQTIDQPPEPSGPSNPGGGGDPKPTQAPYCPVYIPPVRTTAPTPEPSVTPTPEVLILSRRMVPTTEPTAEAPDDSANAAKPAETAVPTEVPVTVPTPEPREPEPVQKTISGDPSQPMSREEMAEIVSELEKKLGIPLPTIIIDDFGTPLGLGNVFINVGDCLE